MNEPIPYMPVIVEATKFLFGELGKWLDAFRPRTGRASDDTPGSSGQEETPKLTAKQFSELEADHQALAQMVNRQQAEANAYLIEGLVEQIKIHHKNLTDHESTAAEYGALTPQHIKRAIERETSAIVEKSARLRQVLEQVYEGSLRNV